MSAISAPLAVKATFLLSGMLGLQLQIPDGSGHTQTVETSVPFNIKPNVTTMMMNFHHPLPRPHQPDNNNHKGNIGGYRFNNEVGGNCGERDCHSGEETCVTWQLQSDPRQAFSECMPVDGRFSTKSNPLSLRLCPPGQTHSLIHEPQPCLQGPNPCPLRWKYNCVREEDSPHICKLRKCPEERGWCVQFIQCQRHPPCITTAQCYHRSELLH